LRDCSPAQVPKEVAARYWNNPIFLRVLTDHMAAMTDTFALKEYDRLHSPLPRSS
jgi:dGTP triphosphohydrolase